MKAPQSAHHGPTEQSPLLAGAAIGGKGGARSRLGLSVAALVRLVTCGCSLAEGYNLGIFSVAILPIAREFGLGPMHISFLAGAPALAMTAVTPFSGIAIDRVGRKPIIAAGYVLMTVGSLALAASHTFAAMVLARSILMAGCQMGFAAATVYMAEVAPSRSRGMLVSLEEIFVNLGFLWALSMGRVLATHPGITWRTITALGAVLPLLCLLLLAWPAVPESARFLHLQRRTAEARQLLQEALGDYPEEVERTLRSWAEDDAVRKAVSAEEAEEAEARDCTDKARQFQLPAVIFDAMRLRAVISACGLLMVKAVSGHSHLGLYLVVFMSSVTDEADATWWAMLWQAMKVVTLFPACFLLLDHVGRRPLLMGSVAGGAVSLFGVAACFAMDLGPRMLGAAFVCYAVAFSIGLGPVSYVYVSEVLPPRVRGTVMGAIVVPPKVLEVAVLSTILPLFDHYRSLPFFLLACANVCGIAFIFNLCPETRGMVLEDIQTLFDEHPHEKLLSKKSLSGSL